MKKNKKVKGSNPDYGHRKYKLKHFIPIINFKISIKINPNINTIYNITINNLVGGCTSYKACRDNCEESSL